MTPKMPAPHLGVSEICRIIKACRDSGVCELTFADLSIRFPVLPAVTEIVTDPYAYSIDSPESANLSTKIQQSALELDELRAKEARLEQMKIESPLEFEELFQAGELEDGETHDR